MNRKSKNILHNSVQIKAEKTTVFSLSEAFEPLGHPPFFSFVQRRMYFLILGRSVGLKKKNLKKNHKEVSEQKALVGQNDVKTVYIYIFGLTKCTIYCKKRSCFSLCRRLYMLIFQIKRIISNEKWFNYVATFFFENAKTLGRSDDAKRRKKERMALRTFVSSSHKKLV